MKITIHLDNGEEAIGNLSIANAIFEFCKENKGVLNPTIIAKVILIAMESEDTE